jgi:hypothetical protein
MNRLINLLIILSIIFILVIIPVVNNRVEAQINTEDGLINYIKLDEEDQLIKDTNEIIEGKKHGTQFVDNNIVFDGENDFIELNNFNLINIGQGSISVWFKVQDIPNSN